jgi:hypothetical protein
LCATIDGHSQCNALVRTGSSDHADGAAPSIPLAHGKGGPLGSHCATATYAALQPLPITPARRRRFQRTTRINAGTSQRAIPADVASVLRRCGRVLRRCGRVLREGGSLQASGSAGTAVATDDRAMLWTDGRYSLAGGAGAASGCESDTHAGPLVGNSYDPGLAVVRVAKQDPQSASPRIEISNKTVGDARFARS